LRLAKKAANESRGGKNMRDITCGSHRGRKKKVFKVGVAAQGRAAPHYEPQKGKAGFK